MLVDQRARYRLRQPRLADAAGAEHCDEAMFPERPDLAAHGLISPVLDAERFVALRAPLRYLGDKSCTLGARIEFRFRAVTNSLVPSEFNRASSAVVLRADPKMQLEIERYDESKLSMGSST